LVRSIKETDVLTIRSIKREKSGEESMEKKGEDGGEGREVGVKDRREDGGEGR
jgi:hypothetical protein